MWYLFMYHVVFGERLYWFRCFYITIHCRILLNTKLFIWLNFATNYTYTDAFLMLHTWNTKIAVHIETELLIPFVFISGNTNHVSCLRFWTWSLRHVFAKKSNFCKKEFHWRLDFAHLVIKTTICLIYSNIRVIESFFMTSVG